MGLLQYLAPTLQFVFGLLIFHEPMGSARWVGFVLVWIALVIFTVDILSGGRRRRRELQRSAENVAC